MWLLAATAVLLGVIPCGVACVQGDEPTAVVGLQTASTMVTMALLLLAVAFDRSTYVDVALLTAALSFVGGLVFVRYLEGWR